MPSPSCRHFCMPRSRAIIGIDPAWTGTQPSGVSLVAFNGDRWHCVAVAPSYAAFCDLAAGSQINWLQAGAFPGGQPNPAVLLDAARALLNGQPIELVTVDMPVANISFTTRRPADQGISRAFGRYKCSTHSPSAMRPGAIGRMVSEGFQEHGYEVATTATAVGASMKLLEVYPHTALLRLLNVDERFQYKAGKSLNYWPGRSPRNRIALLLENFQTIITVLGKHIDDIVLPLPTPTEVITLTSLKRYEDAIDALICAWVGICYLNGTAEPYGDETAAIWVPTVAVE